MTKFLVYNDTGMTPEINTPTGLDIGPTRTSWANELSSARFWCRIIIPLPVAWWSTMYANRMPVFTDAASISNVHLRGIAESISPLLVNIISSSFLHFFFHIYVYFISNKTNVSSHIVFVLSSICCCFSIFDCSWTSFFFLWLLSCFLLCAVIIFFCFVVLFCFVLFFSFACCWPFFI